MAEISLVITSLIIAQPLPEIYFPAQATISRLLFGIICVLGITAGIAPKWCSFGSKSERRELEGAEGHHPDCGKFIGHTIRLGFWVFCAGCSGLVIGAFLALIGLFSGFFPIDAEVGFWVGIILVGLGLAQHYIDLGNSWVHLLLNIFLVMGTWLMFEAIQLMNLSFLVSAYFLAMAVFWIFARIRASQWTHVGICEGCETVCSIRFE